MFETNKKQGNTRKDLQVANKRRNRRKLRPFPFPLLSLDLGLIGDHTKIKELNMVVDEYLCGGHVRVNKKKEDNSKDKQRKYNL